MKATDTNLTSPAQLRALFAAHGFRPRKRLGRHFLIDRNVLDRVVASARLAASDQVLEIGAGAGALTQKLAETAKQVVAIEVDARLEVILRQMLAGRGEVELVIGDALALDLGRWLKKGRWKVVANLPYYITSPLIARLLEFRDNLSWLVLMMQEEVAERLLAAPGTKEYGSLSVLVQSYSQGARAAKVSRHCFYPEPEVDSSVVTLEMRAHPVAPEQLAPLFFRIVRAAFGRRRKMLPNALASLSDLTSEELAGVLAEADIAPDRRGETLAPEDFARLAAAWARALRESGKS